LTSNWKNYHVPQSVEQAVALLQRYDGQARVIGGGTDLLVELRRGLHRPVDALVDASRIDGLTSITQDNVYIVIGCGVTHTQIINDQRIIRHGACLSESCSVIGGPQVRNVGTLAGNVAHALPAGDGTIGLLALGGDIEVADSSGHRWIPVKDAFLGPGKSVLDRHKALLTRLRFKPTAVREGSAHHRVMRPQGVCLPIISMAARLRLGDDDSIAAVNISMGPVGPVPYLAEAAMAALVGGPATTQQFENAAEIVLQSITLRTSKYRATQEYRMEMIRTYLPIILACAAERAADASAISDGSGS